jgi:SAM-dependent methyltransferase
LIDLAERARGHELLDEGVSDEEARRSLADLRFVNRWLGNGGRFAHTVRRYLETAARPRLLDVGCGSADVPARLVSKASRPLLAVGVDVKLLHVQDAPAEVRCVVADVRALPFPPASFDVVTASLFLHHFHGPEVAEVLGGLWRLTRGALVVNDLRRARVPYVFGRALFPLLFRSYVSVADGLLSIRRGFTSPELAAAFAAAGIAVDIHHSFPYRLLAVAEKRAA